MMMIFTTGVLQYDVVFVATNPIQPFNGSVFISEVSDKMYNDIKL